MTLASEVNYTRIINDPEIGLRVSPNAKRSYMVNAILALSIPAMILLLLELLDNKVRGVQDVTRRTKAPILGIIVKEERDSKVAFEVKKNLDYSPYNEGFRYLRSSLINHTSIRGRSDQKDNGEIVGLENDFQSISIIKKAQTNREKKDKAENWIREFLRQNIVEYQDIVTTISIKFESHNNKDVMRIKVPKSNVPVYPSPTTKNERT